MFPARGHGRHRRGVAPSRPRGRKTQMADRITIFDTTLRDGEQAPGCSMTVAEKVRMAEALGNLGIDLLEGGLPHRVRR